MMDSKLVIKRKILSLKVPNLKVLLTAVNGWFGLGKLRKTQLQFELLRLLNEGTARERQLLLMEIEKLEDLIKRPNRRAAGRGEQASTNCPNSVTSTSPPPGGTRPGLGIGLSLTAPKPPSVTTASAFPPNPFNYVGRQPQLQGNSCLSFQELKTQSLGQQNERPSVGNKDDTEELHDHDPIHPDIKMKDLPFFDCLSEPIPLSKLIKKGIRFKLAEGRGKEMMSSVFIIPPARLKTAGTHGDIYFLLRFGDLAMASPDRELYDLFPPHLRVIVNGNVAYYLMQSVFQGKVKINNGPINITKFISLNGTTNTITVIWEDNGLQTYVMSMLAGSPLTALTLRTRLLAKPPLPVSTSMSIVQRLTSEEHQGLVCAPPSVRVSLTCPLGKQRMRYPCRGVACRHLQCFDGYAFLQMNEKKLKFNCPVCGGRLKFEDLCVDGFFQDIIKTVPLQAGEYFNIHRDGRLEPVVEAQREEIDVDCDSPNKRVSAGENDDVVILNSSRSSVPVQKQVASNDKNGTKGEPELIVLDD